ncbi:hypothetical protein BYT27DRAFT_7092155 [Phlegmacium glaucopus]|nr:hypothetical protein BYT27DRAFT_7092155 [Phlegmacium glaucopus]
MTLTLSWIWQMGMQGNSSSPEELLEFNRVHWLCAQAQKHRWREEFTLVGYEMQWTVKYFMHQAGTWDCWGTISQQTSNRRARAYAAHKAAMWGALASVSQRRFQQVNKQYV